MSKVGMFLYTIPSVSCNVFLPASGFDKPITVVECQMRDYLGIVWDQTFWQCEFYRANWLSHSIQNIKHFSTASLTYDCHSKMYCRWPYWTSILATHCLTKNATSFIFVVQFSCVLKICAKMSSFVNVDLCTNVRYLNTFFVRHGMDFRICSSK